MGLVLYEAATGRYPFPCGSVFEILNAIASLDVEAPSALNVGIPQVAAIDGYGCSSVYAAFDSSTWRTFPNFAKPQTFDAYIMAEGPKGSPNDTEVSPDLIRLFTGIGNVDVFNSTQIGLGMPRTILFTSSNLTVSPGQLYDPSHPRTCE